MPGKLPIDRVRATENAAQEHEQERERYTTKQARLRAERKLRKRQRQGEQEPLLQREVNDG
jgi:hypothetical protein